METILAEQPFKNQPSCDGKSGDPLFSGNLTTTLFNATNTLEVVRQRLLLGDENEIGWEELDGLATIIATVKADIARAMGH